MRENLREKVRFSQDAPAGAEPAPISEQKFDTRDLGGGTDYIAFFNHLGIPSTDMEFEGPNGVYHSKFDNHRWMKQFGDPKFLYHVTAARLLGLMCMRLAEADLLPLDYATYGERVLQSLERVRNRLALIGEENQLDLQPAQNAAQELIRTARQLAEQYQSISGRGNVPPNLYEWNRILVSTEKAFLLPQGLPGRRWYKHALYAPGKYSGYDPVALPGIQESADAENFDQARFELQGVTAALNRAADLLRRVH
jgi:N-acetylated-alpha-linked acidic dipeptidase